MTVAIPATAPSSFEIKSASLPLVALLLKSPDLALLASELRNRFGDIPDFFDNDPLVLDLGPLQASGADESINFAALLAMLRDYRLSPVAAKSGSPAQMAAALASGLVAAPDARLTGNRQRADSEQPQPVQQVQLAASPPASPPQPPLPQGALIIDKPLRSGQQIYARGRDLVVLSMVNAGAEVIADGHIHVYAPLRGKAMAGARGNTDARIFSLALDAELLSIAGVYRTSETPLPASIQGKPAQVRLVSSEDGDKLVMDSMP
jgi:septum site-determining protein MinC